MWTNFAIALEFLACVVVAVPTKNEVVKSFQEAIHRQDVHSILISIEDRLRNLDNIYSMHLATTLEEKLEQYQRKLESIDTKIIRLESLVTLNLDKISENISTRNFKEDFARTNLAKKVDVVYESLSHRLNYMDRKLETSTGRIQGKVEATLTRLERMDESFTTKNEEIEIEMSDVLAALDEFKTVYTGMEDNILNNTNENFEIALKEQMLLMKSFNDKSNKALQTVHENTSRSFESLERKIGSHANNKTDQAFQSLRHDLKRELNEYAVKVAEMNSENWKTATLLHLEQNRLETAINSTKTEVQNGVRALMVLIGKTFTKELPILSDESPLNKLKQEIDAKFEKVFSAQNLFLDSCYRLQMDESQIESKISDLLEKLIEMFERKTAIEIKDINNLETLIKNHDAYAIRHLYQTNANVITLSEKFTVDNKNLVTDLKQVTGHLNALFSLIRETLVDENASVSPKNGNLLHNGLKEIKKKIVSLDIHDEALTNSVEEIKKIVNGLQESNSFEVIKEYLENISRVITGMEAKINTVYLYYHFNTSKIDAINQNLTHQIHQLPDALNVITHNQTDRKKRTETEYFSTPELKSTTVIDVRSSLDWGDTTEAIEERSISEPDWQETTI